MNHLNSKNNSEPIKGVWLTNIASDVLFSKSNIEKAVQLCDSLGFNHIFVVTWNDATTTYPSKVMKNLIGVEIQPELKGRDPLKELIDAAHRKNIKVHAWFEFGFSCSYKKMMVVRSLRPNHTGLHSIKMANLFLKTTFNG